MEAREPWRIELFGELRAVRGEVALTRFRTRKAGGLLAYLALFRTRRHPRELLSDLFWPDQRASASRANLRNALTSLRRQLEPPGTPAGSVLVNDRAAVGLHPSVGTDVGVFEAAVRAARSAPCDAERAAALERAVSLHRAELLEGRYEAWIDPERTRLCEAFLVASRGLVRLRVARGAPGAALDLALRALRVDPLREEILREVLRIHVARGERAAARRAYDAFAARLADEVGASPDAETRRIVLEAPRRRTAVGRPVPGPASAPPGQGPGKLATALAVQVTRGLDPTAFAARHRGALVRDGGRATVFAFERAVDALACASALARAGGRPATLRAAVDSTDGAPAPGLDRAERLFAAAREGQILVSESAAALARPALPPDLRLERLGRFRLLASEAPQRLFELRGSDLGLGPPTAPRARPVGTPPLPLRLTRFFGREPELARLRDALAPGAARLVSITGAGGAGKTRLALEAADHATPRFPAGVFFVPLADLVDSAHLGPAIVSALRVEEPTSAPIEDMLRAVGDGPALLVLDNLEQLLQTAPGPGAPVAIATLTTLLARAPELTCLVTSRARLGVAGELEVRLDPLPVPSPAERAPEAIAAVPSVALFVDRAQLSRPDFQVTAANARTVAAISRRLEGIPLALELAAARAQVLSPRSMLDRLEVPPAEAAATGLLALDHLVTRRRDAPARHRTLRATIAWSWRLLAPAARRLLAALTVFRSCFPIEAAAAVCEASVERLDALCAASLLVSEPGPADGRRLRLLETIRAFAAEQLSGAERRRLERRHARFFLTFAEGRAAAPHGAAAVAPFDGLALELDGFRQALGWATGPSGDPGLGLGLAVALRHFFRVRCHLDEGRRWLTAALDRAPERSAARAAALEAAGALASAQGDLAHARALVEEAIAIQRTCGEPRQIAVALNTLGTIARSLGELEAADASLAESLAIFRSLGERRCIAQVLANQALVAGDRGDYRTARAGLEEGGAILRELGAGPGLAPLLAFLGVLLTDLGAYARADAVLEESAALARERGDERMEAYAVQYRSYLAVARGCWEAARARADASLATFERLGDGNGVAWCLGLLGRAAAGEGDFPSALALLERGRALVRDGRSRVELLVHQGRIHASAGEPEQARACLQEGLVTLAAAPPVAAAAACFEGFAAVAQARCRPGRAARLAGAADGLREALATPVAPADHAMIGGLRAAARTALGARRYAKAFAAGRALAWDEAVALALATSGHSTVRHRSPATRTAR